MISSPVHDGDDDDDEDGILGGQQQVHTYRVNVHVLMMSWRPSTEPAADGLLSAVLSSWQCGAAELK